MAKPLTDAMAPPVNATTAASAKMDAASVNSNFAVNWPWVSNFFLENTRQGLPSSPLGALFR